MKTDLTSRFRATFTDSVLSALPFPLVTAKSEPSNGSRSINFQESPNLNICNGDLPTTRKTINGRWEVIHGYLARIIIDPTISDYPLVYTPSVASGERAA